MPVCHNRKYYQYKDNKGAVLIVGCHPRDCYYIDGNYKTETGVELTKRLLEQSGVKLERLRLEWLSASGVNQICRSGK